MNKKNKNGIIRISSSLMGTKEDLFAFPKTDGSPHHPQDISRALYRISYLKKRYKKMQVSLKELKAKRKKKPAWLVLIRQALYIDGENGPKFEKLSDYFRVCNEREFEENNFRMSGNTIFCKDFPTGYLLDIVTKEEFEKKYAHLEMSEEKQEEVEREIEHRNLK